MICCPPPPMDQHGGREGPGQSVKYVKTACYKMIGAIVIGKEPVWFDLLLYSPCLQPGPRVTCLCLLDISSHAGTIVFILEFKFVDFQWKLEILHCSTFYSKPPSEVWDCFCLACGLRPPRLSPTLDGLYNSCAGSLSPSNIENRVSRWTTHQIGLALIGAQGHSEPRGGDS